MLQRALHIAQIPEDEDALVAQLEKLLDRRKPCRMFFDSDTKKLSKLRREVKYSNGTAADMKDIKLVLELTGAQRSCKRGRWYVFVAVDFSYLWDLSKAVDLCCGSRLESDPLPRVCCH